MFHTFVVESFNIPRKKIKFYIDKMFLFPFGMLMDQIFFLIF